MESVRPRAPVVHPVFVTCLEDVPGTCPSGVKVTVELAGGDGGFGGGEVPVDHKRCEIEDVEIGRMRLGNYVIVVFRATVGASPVRGGKPRR